MDTRRLCVSTRDVKLTVSQCVAQRHAEHSRGWGTSPAFCPQGRSLSPDRTSVPMTHELPVLLSVSDLDCSRDLASVESPSVCPSDWLIPLSVMAAGPSTL